MICSHLTVRTEDIKGHSVTTCGACGAILSQDAFSQEESERLKLASLSSEDLLKKASEVGVKFPKEDKSVSKSWLIRAIQAPRKVEEQIELPKIKPVEGEIMKE